MLTFLIRIVEIFVCGALFGAKEADCSLCVTSCLEFGHGSSQFNLRFNHYDVLDSLWKIFYVWGDITELYPVVFSMPGKDSLEEFRKQVMTANPSINVKWNRSILFMDPRPDQRILFIYNGKKGTYKAIVKKERRSTSKHKPLHLLPLIDVVDIQLKMVGRVMGMMRCDDRTTYALIRIDELPLTEDECRRLANTIGFKGRPGRSHLEISEGYAVKIK